VRTRSLTTPTTDSLELIKRDKRPQQADDSRPCSRPLLGQRGRQQPAADRRPGPPARAWGLPRRSCSARPVKLGFGSTAYTLEGRAPGPTPTRSRPCGKSRLSPGGVLTVMEGLSAPGCGQAPAGTGNLPDSPLSQERMRTIEDRLKGVGHPVNRRLVDFVAGGHRTAPAPRAARRPRSPWPGWLSSSPRSPVDGKSPLERPGRRQTHQRALLGNLQAYNSGSSRKAAKSVILSKDRV